MTPLAQLSRDGLSDYHGCGSSCSLTGSKTIVNIADTQPHRQRLCPLKYAYDSLQWHYMSITTFQITDCLCNMLFRHTAKEKLRCQWIPLTKCQLCGKRFHGMTIPYVLCLWYSLQWARWRLKSPASRLFTQPFIQGADRRKHQSSASLAFVRGITGERWIPHTQGPVTRKMFPFDDVIMCEKYYNPFSGCYMYMKIMPWWWRGRHEYTHISILLETVLHIKV